MFVAIIVWDLTESAATVESLRLYLRDYAIDAYSSLKGMHQKVWFSNSYKQIWGAVYLWDGVEYLNSPVEVSRAKELIGYDPVSYTVFEVEAVAEGVSCFASLARVGRALESEG